jgi:hypothetical protein
MATFTVDPATLDELSSTLSGIHAEMQAMHGVATGYGGLLGGGDLEGEVEHFCSHWGYGIGKLGDHMGKVVERLKGAATTYGKSESEIQSACKGGER